MLDIAQIITPDHTGHTGNRANFSILSMRLQDDDAFIDSVIDDDEEADEFNEVSCPSESSLGSNMLNP